MGESFTAGLKELLRTALFAVIPLLISQLQLGKIEIQTVVVAGAIAILSGLSEWLHKDAMNQPKATRNEGFLGEKGLSGF